MPYEPTPIIIYPDPQADPPVVADLNTAAWDNKTHDTIMPGCNRTTI